MLLAARHPKRLLPTLVDKSFLPRDAGKQAKLTVDQIIEQDVPIEVFFKPKQTGQMCSVTVLRENVVEAGLIRKRTSAIWGALELQGRPLTKLVHLGGCLDAGSHDLPAQ